MKQASVRCLWKDAKATQGFHGGVSLHSHTMHSKELLTFIPRYTKSIPLLQWEFDRQSKRYEQKRGRPLDLSSAYWTPPLPGREAFEVEQKQIEDLGLAAMVSLTDHDNIDAGSQLQVLDREVPISVEWSIPFGPTYFHVGVHNLPPYSAHDTMAALATYTAKPDLKLLKELFAGLHRETDGLIVLNHPMWDQSTIGAERHKATLLELLKQTGQWIDALELNGLRPCHENRAVGDLARELGWTLVSGGDRHGREPNANINLTNAASFAEFAEEVRQGQSEILFLPQYREPFRLRVLKGLREVLSDAPDLAGRERWVDRVFFSPNGTDVIPLAQGWKGDGPPVVRYFVRGVCLLGSHRVQRALRPLMTKEDYEFAVTQTV